MEEDNMFKGGTPVTDGGSKRGCSGESKRGCSIEAPGFNCTIIIQSFGETRMDWGIGREISRREEEEEDEEE